MQKKNPSASKKKGKLSEARASGSGDAEDRGGLVRIIPNPLKNRGEVSLDLPITGQMKIELVDLGGKNILRLFEGEYEGGPLSILFDAGSLPQDAYICIVEVSGERYHRLVMVN